AVAPLAAPGLPVLVVNPRQVRDFGKARGQLAKTDAISAAILAHFADAMRPPVRPLPDATTQELHQWLARRRQLVEMMTAENNRLPGAARAVRPAIQAHLGQLRRPLEGLEPRRNAPLEPRPVVP